MPRGVAPGVVGALLALVCLPGLVPPGTLRLSRGLAALVAVRWMFTATYSAPRRSCR